MAVKKKHSVRKNRRARSKERVPSQKELKSLFRMLKKNGANISDTLSSVRKMRQLEADTGKNYADLAVEYEKLADQVKWTSENAKEMEKRKSELLNELNRLEDLKLLQRFLEENNVSSRELYEFIIEQRRLEELGYDSGTIRLLAGELAKHGVDPSGLKEKILKFSPKATSLEQVLFSLERKIAEARKEESATMTRLDSLKMQAEEAKAGVLALQDHLASQSRDLEKEYETRKRVLDSRIQEERAIREQETMELLKLRDRTAGAVQALKEEEQAIKEKIKASDKQKGTQ